MSEENTDKPAEEAVQPQTQPQPQKGKSAKKNKKGKDDKPETLHLKTKPVPAVIMLVGGLFITVIVFIQQFEFKKALLTILVGMIVFLIVGDIVKMLLDRIEIPNPELMDADGNVIEKGKSGENDETEESSSGNENKDGSVEEKSSENPQN
ncbi:MAG: hypothetical protein K6G03_05635 [Lachnospiraceae bacterium]|nr:hypothetical protein [Lachnospiraceae bacterium]